ncbi:MAG TPA: biotin--[acetyl-CoA-carboxylase] ligase [Armatimonadota bacterium]|nr:biotin--[acetyl-CoA-carboxylase] ligase [Armatimonadota bacterium]HQK92996.1 biotin--[acetyl-CoA-carboxylase] ligase [Armatimonadota bacterium]
MWSELAPIPDWIGRVVHLDRVGSTMDAARDLAFQPGAPAILVAAEEQTAGRGRRGAVWHSVPGLGLAFSVLLRPVAAPEAVGLYSLAAAHAVAEAVRRLGVKSATKWPNDVWARGRKLAGVLVESAIHEHRLAYVSIGIGLNANEAAHQLPEAPPRGATSLRVELGAPVDRSLVGASVLDVLGGLLDARLAPRPEPIIDGWRRTDICLGHRLEVSLGAEEFVCVGRDITQTGALIVEDDSGALRELVAGRVRVALVNRPA